MTFQH